MMVAVSAHPSGDRVLIVRLSLDMLFLREVSVFCDLGENKIEDSCLFF